MRAVPFVGEETIFPIPVDEHVLRTLNAAYKHAQQGIATAANMFGELSHQSLSPPLKRRYVDTAAALTPYTEADIDRLGRTLETLDTLIVQAEWESEHTRSEHEAAAYRTQANLYRAGWQRIAALRAQSTAYREQLLAVQETVA